MARISASAIILAAGSSKRMGRDKQFIKIGGSSIIERTVGKFLSLGEIGEILLVLSQENILKKGSIFSHDRIKLIAGGKTRMESLRNGFTALSPSCCLVAVHDGARPFVPQEVILRCLAAAERTGAAVPVVPLKDTVKEIDIKSMKILRTLQRSTHYAAQTPQCYRKEILEKLLGDVNEGEDLTDESQALEKLGLPIAAVPGDYRNVKITTEDDLLFFSEAAYEKKIC